LRRATIHGLAWLARRYLRRVRPRCVAIAGLSGKTVAKRWLRELLQTTFRVRANPRSYNTELGLPLAILDTAIDSSTFGGILAALGHAGMRGLFASEPIDVLVLEMGIRSRGDAERLLEAVTPNVLVLMPIAPSFSDDLAFLETMEREIARLARAVAERGGSVVSCADDPRLAAAVMGLPAVRSYGRAQAVYEGSELRLEVAGEVYPVGLDVVGESSIYALLAGVEVARILDIDDARLRAFLAGETPIATRTDLSGL
jgi:UDP-N-acetylmuramyl pentapeptide synthase